jgi:hypothetical protein
MDKNLPQAFTPEDLARRRRRAMATAIILVIMAALFFITTIVRLGGNVGLRAL